MKIIDAMNYVRRVFEKDLSGRAPRTIISEVLATTNEAQIWVWDAPGAKATRQQILASYKAKRLPPPENIWPIIDLISEALTHTSALQIKVPRFEADDVIASIVRRYPQEDKLIVSNDADLRQLLVVPNTRIEAKPNRFNIDPKYVRLFKTCVGDASDNVAGIPGFGVKTWEAVNKKALDENIKALISGGVAHVGELGLPQRCVNWLNENSLTLIDTWTVVGLWDVPIDLINKNTRVGKRDPQRANLVLSQFYH